MGMLDRLLGKKCEVCHQKLEFGGKVGLTVGSGVGGFEALLSKQLRCAYRCSNCGSLMCYSCARTNRCPKCGKNRFELAIQSQDK
jgi:hypothetical protein